MRTLPTLVVAAAAMMIGLGACSTPPTGTADPARTHPIRVELETFQVAVPLSRAATAQPLPAQFVEEYYRRGRGPMTVVLPAASGADAVEAGRTVAAWLKERLIPATVGRAIDVAEVPDGSMEVFFKAYVAQVPECGDWRGATGYNPNNLPHTDFGCSVQRNVGLMLSDPGELLGTATTGAPDAPRLVDTMERYRSGQGQGAAPPVIEQTTIQLER